MCLNKCPLSRLLDEIGGKWKILIIFNLNQYKILRYGQLQRTLPTISQKVLTSQLRDLEKNGYIKRKIYKQIPPKVEYRLTAKGISLFPVLDSLGKWASEHYAV